MRVLLVVLVLIGCGGGPREGSDCSAWASPGGVTSTCTGSEELWCCATGDRTCNGLAPNVWHAGKNCTNGCNATGTACL